MQTTPAAPARETRLQHLRRFAHWLDDWIRLPLIGYRIGLDPILGVVPGLGDAAGAVLAAGILLEAARAGASRHTLVRMALNIGIDALVGAVPLLGDLFDAAWKANLRNLALLDRHLAGPPAARRGDRLFVVMLGGFLLALSAALVAGGALLSVMLIRALVRT